MCFVSTFWMQEKRSWSPEGFLFMNLRMTPEAPPPTVKLWRWVGLSLLLSFALWYFCLSVNPATLALTRSVNALVQDADSSLPPLLSVLLSYAIHAGLGSTYLKVKLVGVLFATFAMVLIPLGTSAFWAGIGHPILKIGGAAGGWRMTWRAYALHRVVCDGLTLLVLSVVTLLHLKFLTAFGLLMVLLPLIRIGSMIYLWVLLSKAHELGVARHLLLGLPKIFFGALFSCLVAWSLALWFGLYYLVAAVAKG